MGKMNKQWYPYEQVGNYFRLIDGVLTACPMLADGSMGTEDEICEVDWSNLDNNEPIFEKDGQNMTDLGLMKVVAEELEAKA